MAWGTPTLGSWSSAHSFSAPSMVVTAPSHDSGDLLLLMYFWRQGTGTPNTPTGWTAIQATLSERCGLYARIADGGANDSPTVTFTGASVITGVIAKWPGGNLTFGSMLNTSATQYTATQTSPNGKVDVAAITPSVDNCLVLRMAMTLNDDPAWTGYPSGDTFLSQNQPNLDDDMSAAISYRIQTSATAVALGTYTNGSFSAEGRALSLALTAADTAKYLKLLAHSSAASESGVAGVVLNSAKTEVVGEFSGQAFEASLESGEAVLLVSTDDIAPNGSALSIGDTPLVAAYNSTYGTVGLGSATVIEV